MSPPYKDKDGYSDVLMRTVLLECFRVQKKNTLLFLNFGHLAGYKGRAFHVANIAEECGYVWNDTITWKKTQYSPVQGNTRLNNLTEFIFILHKGKMPKLNRLAVGVPYKDKHNIGRYSDNDLRCGGNFWEFGYETIQNKDEKLHNDRFPVELPRRCIKLCGYTVKKILDPFMGSGTTGVAALEQGKTFIGIDKNKRYAFAAKKRLMAL
jgi:DNA modification methylase